MPRLDARSKTPLKLRKKMKRYGLDAEDAAFAMRFALRSVERRAANEAWAKEAAASDSKVGQSLSRMYTKTCAHKHSKGQKKDEEDRLAACKARLPVAIASACSECDKLLARHPGLDDDVRAELRTEIELKLKPASDFADSLTCRAGDAPGVAPAKRQRKL
jgi:hypothetical protein